MPQSRFEILTIPCLQDNYAFLIGDPVTGNAALVDVPEAAPIMTALARTGWRLTDVLLTHHHPDHVMGLTALGIESSVSVIGAAADAHRLPPLDIECADGDTLDILGAQFDVLDVSGHTNGHVAFVCEGAAFTADSLMAMGCGRLFEGTPAQMWDSLLKLRALPDETMIYSGHEYTTSNMKFALSLGEDNPAVADRADAIEQARAANQPTVPSVLAIEKATNPFLRADDANLQAAIGMPGADPAAVFTEIRARKDRF